MRRPPPDYDKIEQKKWRENAKKVVSRLDNRDRNLAKRIQTFVSRFGYPRNQVEAKIRRDRLFASHFALEPRRTGLHENVAAKWINELDAVSNFETLSKSGKNAYYVTSDGEIRKGMEHPPTKSLDFMWTTGNTLFFATHKYTKESGGNQDSQFKEVRHLLELFQKGNISGDIVLIAIVDGPYYNSRRMDDLRRFTRERQPLSFAIPIEELPSLLDGFT